MTPRNSTPAPARATAAYGPVPALRRERRWPVPLLLVAVAAVLVLAGPAVGIASAAPVNPAMTMVMPTGVPAQGLVLAQAESVDAVLTNVRNWIMGIAAGLATVFITIGAVRYMAANGDLGEVEKAKVCFRSAAFGYALALLTPLVLTVLREIVGAV